VRIEAELQRLPVHEAAREDAVEWYLCGEGTTQKRDVLLLFSGRQERLAQPTGTQQRGVDGRRRSEARPGHAPDEALELDRAHASADVQQGTRHSAAAGTEVEHEHARLDAGVADQRVGEGATTKGMASARPRLV
jgi:hypothetical protein